MNSRIHKIEGEFNRSEDWLQEYIANYPNILPLRDLEGIETDLILLGREFLGIDILFVDKRGLITIVEVKRSVDARSKREVLAQILDYAAKIINYESETLCKDLCNTLPKEANKTFRNLSANYEKINEYLSDHSDEDVVKIFAEKILEIKNDKEKEEWINKFKSMQREGSLRLVLVLDEVSKELMELTNYLNSNLSRGTQFAVVELSPEPKKDPYRFIPHLVGASGSLSPIYYREEKFQSRELYDWDEGRFLEQIEKTEYEEDIDKSLFVNEMESLFSELKKDPRLEFHFGSGKTGQVIFGLKIEEDQEQICPFYLNTGAWLTIYRRCISSDQDYTLKAIKSHEWTKDFEIRKKKEKEIYELFGKYIDNELGNKFLKVGFVSPYIQPTIPYFDIEKPRVENIIKFLQEFYDILMRDS